MDIPVCGVCGIATVRLYRPYANFYRPEDNRCNVCLTDSQRKFYVPLMLDSDGSVWGLLSAPDWAVDEFNSLSEADPDAPSWNISHFEYKPAVITAEEFMDVESSFGNKPSR